MEAVTAIGANDLRIVFRHVLPNSFAPLIVVSTALVGFMIIIEASLSFLGIGTPVDVISWGAMLSQQSQSYFIVAPLDWHLSRRRANAGGVWDERPGRLPTRHLGSKAARQINQQN